MSRRGRGKSWLVWYQVQGGDFFQIVLAGVLPAALGEPGGGEKRLQNLQDQPLVVVPMLLAQGGRRE